MGVYTDSNIFLVVGTGLVLCCVVYTLTGTFGYLTFGLDVNSDILKSYPASDPLVIAARVLMAVAMVTRYFFFVQWQIVMFAK